jgi:hypothetical protein
VEAGGTGEEGIECVVVKLLDKRESGAKMSSSTCTAADSDWAAERREDEPHCAGTKRVIERVLESTAAQSVKTDESESSIFAAY